MTTRRPRRSPATPPTPAADQAVPAVAADAALPNRGDTITIPLASQAVFWRPRHTDKARSLTHAPFLFWLVETLRPTRIVQIGLEDAPAYLTLCQAIDKAGLEAVCMGVEAPGEKTGRFGPGSQHATLYGDFSFVAGKDPVAASRHMRGGGVDLLVLDLVLTPELVEMLQSHWLPLLSDRAVLVIHEPETRLADPAARRFLDELLAARPGISFVQGAPGLEVVLLGARPPERLQRLAELETGQPGYLSARQVFARLGQGLAAEQLAKTRQGLLTEAGAARKVLEDELERERSDKDAALEAEAQQVAELATLQAELFELRRAHAAALAVPDRSAEVTALQTGLEEANRKRKEFWQRVEALTGERDALQAELATLGDTLTVAQTDIAGLTTRLAGLEPELQASREDADGVRVQLADIDRKRQDYWQQIERLTAEKVGLAAEVTEARQTASRADEEHAATTALAATLRQDLAAQQAEATALQAGLAAQTEAATAARQDLARHQQDSTAQLAERDRALATRAGELERLQGELAEQVAAQTTRFTEIAALTHLAETLRQDLAAQQAEATALQAGLAAQTEAATAARQDLARHQQDSTAQLAERDRALATRAGELERLQGELAEQVAAQTTRFTEIAAITRLAETLRQEVETGAARAETAGRELSALRLETAGQLASRDAALAEFAVQLEAAQRDLAMLQADLASRSAELTSITQLAEALRADTARHADVLLERDAAQARIDLLQGDLQAARDEIAALRDSTSWKVTAPLRRVKTAVTPGG